MKQLMCLSGPSTRPVSWKDSLKRRTKVHSARSRKLKKEYPGATQFSSIWTEPRVSLNHLPDENDPVPGGMYPGDI